MLTKFRQPSRMILRFPGIVQPPLIFPWTAKPKPQKKFASQGTRSTSRHEICNPRFCQYARTADREDLFAL